MDEARKQQLKWLIEGKLPYEAVKELVRLEDRSRDRFWVYLELLQERVPWDDKILLRISEHLYIVINQSGARVVKCDCGHEFGDYRINWKLNSMIFVRRTEEEFREIYSAGVMPDPNLVEVREYYCPGCYAQLGVEVAPHGYPIVLECLPDLDGLYRQWLEKPLPGEDAGWFSDRTANVTSQWAKERG